MKRFLVPLFALASLALVVATPFVSAQAADAPSFEKRDWAFDGIFGTFDRATLQRGFQVYREVCSACHGLKFVYFRNLSALGYDEETIKALAAEYEVTDGPDEAGAMFQRPARPSDRFVSPFPNDNAARAANNGAFPPDLSLMTKARKGGPDYLYALLTGYTDEPEELEMMEAMYYNTVFPGHQIAMPPPIVEDGVEYADGTPATPEQITSDVVTFLSWAAEPEMVERKRLGLKVMLFLIIFTGLLAAVKRKVWSDLH